MIVPNVGSWIVCRNINGSGKVISLDTGRKICKALFLNESSRVNDNSGGRIGPEEKEISFSDIITRINDKSRSVALEDELESLTSKSQGN